MSLSERTCKPCHGGVQALTQDQIEPLLKELVGWEVVQQHHLKKTFKTADFQKALDLANTVGAIAEKEQHHPDLTVKWGEFGIEIFTHAVNGLTESDFVLAAKIDKETSAG